METYLEPKGKMLTVIKRKEFGFVNCWEQQQVLNYLLYTSHLSVTEIPKEVFIYSLGEEAHLNSGTFPKPCKVCAVDFEFKFFIISYDSCFCWCGWQSVCRSILRNSGCGTGPGQWHLRDVIDLETLIFPSSMPKKKKVDWCPEPTNNGSALWYIHLKGEILSWGFSQTWESRRRELECVSEKVIHGGTHSRQKGTCSRTPRAPEGQRTRRAGTGLTAAPWAW